MIHHAESAKSRTVALPNSHKGLLQPRYALANLHGRALACESAWGQMTFGPYLVPLSRRVE